MRSALATSMHDVFLVAAVVACGGVLVAVFLPENPLRGRQPASALVEAGKELAAEGVGASSPLPAADEPRLAAAEPDIEDWQAQGPPEPIGSHGLRR
jgi:hypothetical protein